MKLIGPDRFSEVFLSVARLERSRLADLWWKSPAGYTRYFIGELLPQVAEALGLSAYSGDYYTLDSIFYESKDVDNFKEHLTYAHYISVAVEHENDIRGSACEVNKLQLFNAPLSVLFTYAHRIDHRDEYLRRYANIVHAGDWSGNAGASRQHLVIFGEKSEELPAWQCYAYANRRYSLIASSS
jgi:hypothetical protein